MHSSRWRGRKRFHLTRLSGTQVAGAIIDAVGLTGLSHHVERVGFGRYGCQ